LDLRLPNDADPVEVVQGRITEANYIKKWVADYLK